MRALNIAAIRRLNVSSQVLLRATWGESVKAWAVIALWAKGAFLCRERAPQKITFQQPQPPCVVQCGWRQKTFRKLNEIKVFAPRSAIRSHRVTAYLRALTMALSSRRNTKMRNTFYIIGVGVGVGVVVVAILNFVP